MSILIKGIEMPSMCAECDFMGGLIMPDNIYTCDCPVDVIRGRNITRAVEEDCRHPDCPLIEVPAPHGRLIDGEEVLRAMNTWSKYGYDERCRLVPWNENLVPYVMFEDMVLAVVGMPTIIDAEE